jgi:hypothetical protein
MQNVITHSQKKSEKLKVVVSGHQELAALEKRISNEKMKNCYLEKANSELQEQLEVQRKAHQEQLEEQEKAHQEQLKDQKEAHQGKPFACLEYIPFNRFLWTLKISSPQSLGKSENTKKSCLLT